VKDHGIPIQSQSARFRLGGTGRGQGFVLLYPDKLTAVSSPAELWGIFLGPLVLAAIAHPLFRGLGALGAVIGVLVGRWIGAGIGKRLAVRKVADGEGVTVIPLDVITSLRLRRSAGISGWLGGQALLVTTADGAEYEFRGLLKGWQADLATALTVRGHQILITPEGITVIVQAVPEAG
jgi:hypothetical protein